MEEKNKNNLIKFTLALAIIDLLLLVFVFSGVLKLQEDIAEIQGEQKIVIKKTEKTTKIDSEKIDTSDWKTYRNEEYGFEVEYPKNLQIDSNDSKNVFIGSDLIHRRPNGVFVRILENDSKETIKSLEQDAEKYEMVKMIENKEVIIGGNIKARKIVLTNPIGTIDFYYVFTKNGINYEISGVNGNEFNQGIISTFNFIEKNINY